MKILYFGDIMGKPGRRAVARVIDRYKEQHKPDVTIANVENLAHGIGVTQSTLEEVHKMGVDVFTSGNHIFDGKDGRDLVDDSRAMLLRPANFPEDNPGVGQKVVTVGEQKLLVINAIGRVFFKENFDDPFRAVDAILEKHADDVDAIFVDFHAEATSEKRAFGLAFDGKVSAIVGTHTHVPTADAQILEKGTAYVSDVGMVGPFPSVIGVQIERVITMFRTQTRGGITIAEDTDRAEVGAVVIDTESAGRAKNIQHIREIVSIT